MSIMGGGKFSGSGGCCCGGHLWNNGGFVGRFEQDRATPAGPTWNMGSPPFVYAHDYLVSRFSGIRSALTPGVIAKGPLPSIGGLVSVSEAGVIMQPGFTEAKGSDPEAREAEGSWGWIELDGSVKYERRPWESHDHGFSSEVIDRFLSFSPNSDVCIECLLVEGPGNNITLWTWIGSAVVENVGGTAWRLRSSGSRETFTDTMPGFNDMAVECMVTSVPDDDIYYEVRVGQRFRD